MTDLLNRRCPPGFLCVHEPQCLGAANARGRAPDLAAIENAAMAEKNAEIANLRELLSEEVNLAHRYAVELDTMRPIVEAAKAWYWAPDPNEGGFTRRLADAVRAAIGTARGKATP